MAAVLHGLAMALRTTIERNELLIDVRLRVIPTLNDIFERTHLVLALRHMYHFIIGWYRSGRALIASDHWLL